ncbi:MAG: class II glutamine amidotransferase [Muribaculaceae bacterium]|nr:class II glutamine amidotransferase [Muribaculaceae bacterium]
MCELFGINGKKKCDITPILQEFFRHSEIHAHGWGLAVFYDDAVSLEKEPVKAIESNYLRARLHNGVKAANAIAHIRLASVGGMSYENCHPFVKHDNMGRSWTLAHNGTIFNPSATSLLDEKVESIDKYTDVQEGSTDSERILYYLIEEINKEQSRLGRSLTSDERFFLLENFVSTLSEGNKLNLLIWDGEHLYIHTNYADSLYYREILPEKSIVFATTPLDPGGWKPVPFLRLIVCRNGEIVYEGTPSSREYFDKYKGWEYENIDYSTL